MSLEKTDDEGHVMSDNTETAKESEETQYVTGFKLGIVLFSTTLVAFLMLLDLAIIVTVSHTRPVNRIDVIDSHKAIPRITTDFHSLSDVGWYGSAYQLAKQVHPLIT